MIRREMVRSLFFLMLHASVSPGGEPPARPDLVDRLLDMPVPAPKWTARNVDYVPPDDTPVDELLDFWSADGMAIWGGINFAPTDAVRRKILAGCVEQPKYFASYYRYLPETPQAYEAIKALCDKPTGPPNLDAAGKQTAHNWLMLQGAYFRADLIAIAKGDPHNADATADAGVALEALARLDWQAAEPVLRKRAEGADQRLAGVALVLAYHHAVAAADRPAENAFREKLKRIAADAKQNIDIRAAVVAELLASSWEGRGAWISSLLGDPGFCHLPDPASRAGGMFQEVGGYDAFADTLKQDPDRFIPVLAKLAVEKEGDIRRTAADRLLTFSRADALRPLLPWLADRDWCAGDGRARLLVALAKVEVPQSVPILSAMVKDGPEDARAWAALALVGQHAAGASAALRKAIEQEDNLFPTREFSFPPELQSPESELVRAAIERNLLTDDEIVGFIEAYAEVVADDEEEKKRSPWFGSREQFWSYRARAGRGLIELSTLRPAITEKLLDRWTRLRLSKPNVASALWEVISIRPNKAVDKQLISRLREHPLTEQVVKSAIARAALLRERFAKNLRQLARRGGEPAGVAAAVLGDRELVRSILEGRDQRAGLMLLACAKAGRMPLPLDIVGRALASSDARLAHGAEQYLECEDSAEARRLVLARHPGEARVLGGEWGEFRPADPNNPNTIEEPFRQEVLAKDGPREIISLTGALGDYIIRIRGNSPTLETRPAPGKFLTRALDPGELKRIMDFIANEHFDDLPQLDRGIIEPSFCDYLHITRDGGRRVAMINPGYGGSAGSPHARLVRLFRSISNKGTFQPHYFLETSIPGTKILLADAGHPIAAVSMHGQDLRVRVDEEASFGLPGPVKGEWHVFANGAIRDPAATPAGFASTSEVELNRPDSFQINGPFGEDQWKTATGNSIILTGSSAGSSASQLHRCQKDQPPKLISDALVADPVATYDGWYIFATSTDVAHAGRLVRVEVSTGKVKNIELPGEMRYEAKAYVPIIDKVLVCGFAGENKYWLVDVATGAAKPFEGNVEPLLHSKGRVIPSAEHGAEVWMAVAVQDASGTATHIGRYNVRSFVWTEVVTLPDMIVSNDHIAVDEVGRVMYVAVNGDLLRVPIATRKQ